MTRLAAFVFGLGLLSLPALVQAEGCTAIYRGATSNVVASWDAFPCPPLPPDSTVGQAGAAYSYRPVSTYAPAQWYAAPAAYPLTSSSYAPTNHSVRVLPTASRIGGASGTTTNLRGYRIRVVYR